VESAGDRPETQAFDYTLKKGGLKVIQQGELQLTNGLATLRAPASEPGTLLLEVKVTGTNGQRLRESGGAVIEPGQIRPAQSRPVDFDKFWKKKLKELSKIPANPQLHPEDSGKSGVDYWQVSLDNIRGTHIRGQLARPTGTGKLPALLIVQWAGVYGLQKTWATDRAASGWLVLNINPHDLPIDKSPSFYEDQFKGPLKDYWAIGNDDRDQSYFLRMYLSCYRAAEYLTTRKDWDSGTLVVMGTSQGGQQTLMTAGFHPKITAALANVPAGCDLTGPIIDRSPGWPAWYYKTEGKDPAKVVEASRYYDVVNFASRIKCPVLVGVGLIDETCPPAGILAAMNQIKGPKEVVLLPGSDHQGKNNTHKPFYDRSAVWMDALVKGQGAPVR
jgi:cephalosporin-C deacetylase-like acetyl esterase